MGVCAAKPEEDPQVEDPEVAAARKRSEAEAARRAAMPCVTLTVQRLHINEKAINAAL